MPPDCEKRITPFRCHVPLIASAESALQITCGGSPTRLTFFSMPFAKKATVRLSGGQKGANAPSVPDSSRAVNDSSGRIQSRVAWPGRDARKARKRPSGDAARNDADGLKLVPSGGATANRTTAALLDGRTRT